MFRNIVRAVHSSTKVCPDYVGQSGLTYSFEKLLQRRPETGSVWVARVETRRFVLKEVPEGFYLNFTEDIWPRLRDHPPPNVRLPCDTVADKRILVYRFFSHDFFDLVKENVSSQLKRRILKSVLQGLADMHDRDLVHLDVKPDNIVLEASDHPGGMTTCSAVQMTDLENAVWLAPEKDVVGMLAGNDNWRSPEAHLRAKLNKPTDLFSFGVMCIYAMIGRIIFGRDDDFEYHVSQGIEPGLIRLQRQTSYFGDDAGYQGLRRHFSPDEQLCQLLDAMWEDRTAPYIPYKHFSTWPEVQDHEFKDVVLKMMNLDPERRVTAREALKHPWFAQVDAI